MSIGRQIGAIATGVAVIVSVSALWVINLRMGPPLDGWTGGPMLIFMPITALILFGAWLVIRFVGKRWVTWSIGTVVIGSGLTALVPTVLNCGPVNCFIPGPERMLGWFVLGATVAGAFVHHVIGGRIGAPPQGG